MRYYWEPDNHIQSNIQIKLLFFNYAIISDVEKAADPSKSGKKADLTSLKSDVGKLDIDELKVASCSSFLIKQLQMTLKKIILQTL